jgi:hypothetical protein
VNIFPQVVSISSKQYWSNVYFSPLSLIFYFCEYRVLLFTAFEIWVFFQPFLVQNVQCVTTWLLVKDPSHYITAAFPPKYGHSDHWWESYAVPGHFPSTNSAARISKGQGYQGLLRKTAGSSFGQKRPICVVQGKTWKMGQNFTTFRVNKMFFP